MVRPSRYDSGQFLDAAARLAATGGPPAVTMAAVAREIGAPSGSVYHRFPDRAALLSELWLRALERFHAAYLPALDDPADPRAGAVAASREMVRFCRDQPLDAVVLGHGAADFGKDTWPPEAVERLDRANAKVMGAVKTLARRLGAQDMISRERVQLAVIDLPYALVQRYLRDGDPLPPHAIALAADCTDAVLRDL
ncbi:helix-turn-helix domain-containing protein [Actinomadura fulvescens]|uniref:TetR family transcriptional regulator n=1 Tax=Actinomadura fulvescens TaxID=46160 RepID=A0ABN3QGJ9_9ACTN